MTGYNKRYAYSTTDTIQFKYIEHDFKSIYITLSHELKSQCVDLKAELCHADTTSKKEFVTHKKNKRMRIGIITHPLRTNYGGVLQAWALQTALKRIGYDAVVLDEERFKTEKSLVFNIIRCIYNFIRYRKFVFDIENKYNKKYSIQAQNFFPFIDKYINRQEISNLETVKDQYNVLISGSDQVFRRRYLHMRNNKRYDFYLEFSKNWDIKRIAYAASFGIDYWDFTEIETIKIKNLLFAFSSISVREASGVDLIKENLGLSSQHVLDPTMLFDKEDYLKLCDGTNIERKRGLMTYILDEDERKDFFINKVAQSRQLPVFRSNSKVENKNARIEEIIQPSIESWLCGFRDADFVITDSFHATVFSIIFHKPFIVIGNEKRGMGRFNSLLSMFGLESHLISSIEQYQPESSYSISSDSYIKLDEWRKKSIEFLQTSLKNGENTRLYPS